MLVNCIPKISLSISIVSISQYIYFNNTIYSFFRTRGVNGNPASVWQEAALRGKARDSCSSRYIIFYIFLTLQIFYNHLHNILYIYIISIYIISNSRYSCIINPLWIVKFLMTTLVY